jgi:hypothetical protein
MGISITYFFGLRMGVGMGMVFIYYQLLISAKSSLVIHDSGFFSIVGALLHFIFVQYDCYLTVSFHGSIYLFMSLISFPYCQYISFKIFGIPLLNCLLNFEVWYKVAGFVIRGGKVVFLFLSLPSLLLIEFITNFCS